MIHQSIKKLVTYALERGLISPVDRVWATNRLLEALKLNEYLEPAEEYTNVDLEQTLSELLDYAAAHGLIEDNTTACRDLFDTMLMGLLTPAPREVTDMFSALYAQSPEAATEYYYKLSRDTDYTVSYTHLHVSCQKGSALGLSKRVRRFGHYCQPFQARKGSKGDRRSAQRQKKHVSEMRALPRE